MDAFENVIKEILWSKGYWVNTSVKVELTKEEKVLIGRPTSPRWELDVVAYSGRDNILKVIECKSYLDSHGVSFKAFDGTDKKAANRFKLFNETKTRQVVFKRLVKQMYEARLCPKRPKVRLCLACGKIQNENSRVLLRKYFNKNRWELFDEDWIRDNLKIISKSGYDNQVSSVVSKLLLR